MRHCAAHGNQATAGLLKRFRSAADRPNNADPHSMSPCNLVGLPSLRAAGLVGSELQSGAAFRRTFRNSGDPSQLVVDRDALVAQSCGCRGRGLPALASAMAC